MKHILMKCEDSHPANVQSDSVPEERNAPSIAKVGRRKELDGSVQKSQVASHRGGRGLFEDFCDD